jgi:cell division protein FtsL
MPICTSLIIYFFSSINQSKEISILGVEKFGKIQIILSIFLLVLCILINTINLLRITRQTYQLKHDNHVNSHIIEGQPLINDDEEEVIELQSTPLGNFFFQFYFY